MNTIKLDLIRLLKIILYVIAPGYCMNIVYNYNYGDESKPGTDHERSILFVGIIPDDL